MRLSGSKGEEAGRIREDTLPEQRAVAPAAAVATIGEPAEVDQGAAGAHRQAPRLLSLGQLLDGAEREARDLYEARKTGQAHGPVTNLPHLDKAIGGWMAPGLHILHGAPGTGKTALALQVSCTCGCPALYVTCEMRPIVLLKRIAARVTETYLGRFSTGELQPDVARELYQDAISQVPCLSILDATEHPAGGADVYEAAAAVRNGPHFLLVVDSLHSYADGMPGRQELGEYERLNDALAGLRALAARLACPVLAVCERNRATMSKGGLSAGAGTRKIEYGAETVLDLDVDDEDDEDAEGERCVSLKLAKNRSGRAGRKIALLFHGAQQRFREGLQ